MPAIDGFESLESSTFLSSFAMPTATRLPSTQCSLTSFMPSFFYPFHVVMEADAIQFNKRNNVSPSTILCVLSTACDPLRLVCGTDGLQ